MNKQLVLEVLAIIDLELAEYNNKKEREAEEKKRQAIQDAKRICNQLDNKDWLLTSLRKAMGSDNPTISLAILYTEDTLTKMYLADFLQKDYNLKLYTREGSESNYVDCYVNIYDLRCAAY